MLIISPSISTTPTSYIKVNIYGGYENSKMFSCASGIETSFNTIGKFIIDQNAKQETTVTPGYFFYLAKKSKRNDPRYGTGGAIVVKLIDSSVTNDKIRALAAANRFVLSIGGAGQPFNVHHSKVNEYSDVYVKEEDKRYKWVIIKTEKGENSDYKIYSMQVLGAIDMQDYNSTVNCILGFRNLSLSDPQRVIPGVATTILPVSVSIPTPSPTKPTVNALSDSTNGSKNKSEEGCIIL